MQVLVLGRIDIGQRQLSGLDARAVQAVEASPSLCDRCTYPSRTTGSAPRSPGSTLRMCRYRRARSRRRRPVSVRTGFRTRTSGRRSLHVPGRHAAEASGCLGLRGAESAPAFKLDPVLDVMTVDGVNLAVWAEARERLLGRRTESRAGFREYILAWELSDTQHRSAVRCMGEELVDVW
jgi:hypothetical protein